MTCSQTAVDEWPVLEFPADRSRPSMLSERRAEIVMMLDADLREQLVRLGHARGATLQETMLAAFLTLVQRYTGQTYLCISTLAGLCGSAAPFRVRAACAETFCALLAAVHAAAGEVHATPGDPSAPLDGRHGIAFAWDAAPEASPLIPFDFGVCVRPLEDGTLACAFGYRLDLFETSTIESARAHFGVLLTAIAADPNSPLDRLLMASAREIERIIDVWGRPRAQPHAHRNDDGEATVHGLVERAAARRPAAHALLEEGRPPIAYAELDGRANRLAHALRERGVGPGIRVGMYVERGAGAVIAMLATLKAGAAYVPLDPAYPAARTALMLDASGTSLIVADAALRATAAEFGRPVFALGDDSVGGYPDDVPPAAAVGPEDLAYVMFTSGTTGTPKAVAIAHRGIVALVTLTPALAFTTCDTALLHGPLTFDASTFFWAALVHGARLAVTPPRPLSLLEFGSKLALFEISVLDLSPAMFHQIVEERLEDLRGLRCCFVGGDVLSPAHAARFVDAFPACRLFNGYGPTETTVIAVQHEVRPGADAARPVPIGRPIAAARAYILDPHRVPAGVGVPGELWLGGAGVARGYLNDPALTSERFVSDPFAGTPDARMYATGDRARWLPDGSIEFLGRADAQIKVRGFRIEPAEIEFALLEHRAVRSAAVAVRGTASADRRIIAYAAVRDDRVDEAALRAFLQTKLPAHAMPARVVLLPELPLTASGKVDRRRLPDPAAAGARSIAGAARSAAEATLAKIAANLLEIQSIGRDDDFFALGGNSLLAMRAIVRIADAFDVDVSLRGFFEAPTVALLAALIARSPRRPTPVRDDLERQLEALSAAELDALLLQTLAGRESSAHGVRLRCIVIGETTLALRCSEMLQQRGYRVVAAVFPPSFDAASWAAEREIPLARSIAGLDAVVRGTRFDYIFSIINLQILDPDILTRAARGGINLHDGPLPRYAGRFATTFAIAAQEREHAVTWHEMTPMVDGGRILKQPRIPIASDETAFSLNMKCYDAALASFAELLDDLASDATAPREQDSAQRTYFGTAARPSPACIIDFAQPAAAVGAFMRALDFGPTPNPIGQPKIVIGEHPYLCRAGDILDEKANGAPGTIVRLERDAIVVAAADRAIRLRDFATLTGTGISVADLLARHSLHPGVLCNALARSYELVAELDRRAARNDAFWAERLVALAPLELNASPGPQDGPPGRIPLESGRDTFVLCAAFAAALAPHVGAGEGDVAFVSSMGSNQPSLADALFRGNVPLRLRCDEAGLREADAHDLRGRCAEAARRAPFARDIVSRIPALRTRSCGLELPIAIVFAPPDAFAEATLAGRLTLLIEAPGARAALLHAGDARTRFVAVSIADSIAATPRRTPQPFSSLLP